MPWTRTGGVEVTGNTVGENGSESVPSAATLRVWKEFAKTEALAVDCSAET
jgi:hypothetical protein